MNLFVDDIVLPFTSQELKLKDIECERLSQVRNQLEQELEELTASLFVVNTYNQSKIIKFPMKISIASFLFYFCAMTDCLITDLLRISRQI